MISALQLLQVPAGHSDHNDIRDLRLGPTRTSSLDQGTHSIWLLIVAQIERCVHGGEEAAQYTSSHYLEVG